MLKNPIWHFYNISQKLTYCPIVNSLPHRQTHIMHVIYTYTPSMHNCFLSGRQFGCVPALIIIDICIHCPPPDPFSVTCTLSTPLFPLCLPSHACTHTQTHACVHTHVRPHTTAALHSHTSLRLAARLVTCWLHMLRACCLCLRSCSFVAEHQPTWAQWQ